MDIEKTPTPFGRYQLIASLGQGGMAKVYLAVAGGLPGFRKLLVVKVLRAELMREREDSVRMFMDEARLGARLVHPNIVHTYEVGEVQGHYFLSLEFLEGQPYSALLRRARNEPGALPLAEHLRIVSEVARGLHYAHKLTGYQGEPLGVVHRDVSPQNVFVTYQGHVKLLDFGIAKTHEAESPTQIGVIKGKLDYIAPEQLSAETIDGRADIFALGAILWEAIAGQRFSGGKRYTEAQKVQARLNGAEPKLRSVVPDIAPELEAIVERALALSPDARWPDAGALADALDAYLASLAARPSAQTLEAIVQRLFAPEREALARLIDEQLQRAQPCSVQIGDMTGELPRVSLPASPGSGSFAASPVPSIVPPAAPDTGAQPLVPGARRRGRAILTGAAVSVAVAAGGLLAWFDVGSSGQTASPRVTAAGTAREPSAAARVAPGAMAAQPSTLAEPRLPASEPLADTVNVRVTTHPDTAQVFIDGVSVGASFSGAFRRDRALHRIEVLAPGHRPLAKFVSFDRDQTLDIVLARPKAVSASTPSSAQATPPPASERPPQRGPSASSKPGGDLFEGLSHLEAMEPEFEDPYARRK